MGNLCVSNQTKYDKIESNLNEIQLDVLEVFDINVARKNSKSISVDSKKIYEEHMKNVLPKLITLNSL